jgi:Leucine-rich repeat (LRR) protein
VLIADNTKIENIDTLSRLTQLQKLYVDETAVDDRQVQELLKKNPNCLVVYKTKKLQEWWNELPESWRGVFEKQVKKETKLTREYLHRIAELEKVEFRDGAMTDLAALAPFIRLKELHFSGTSIHDISAVANIKTLKSLRMNDNPLRDLGAVAQIADLEDLDVSNTPVAELEVIEGLRNLKRFNCAGTQVKKLNSLEEFKDLESLDCSNTPVKSIDAVMDLPLKSLKCYNTKIPGKQIERFKKNHPECNVVYYR